MSVAVGRESDLGVYERAEDAVDRVLEGQVGAELCRRIGQERAQVAILKSIINVAGNLLAKLAGASEAERLHRQRATHYAVKAAREPAKWTRRR